MALAHPAGSPGGVIEILPGTHVGAKAAAVISKPITVRSVRDRSNPRPTLDRSNGGILKATGSSFIRPASNIMGESIGLKAETQYGSERLESYMFENCVIDDQRRDGTVINNRSPVAAVVRGCAVPRQRRMVGAVKVEQ